MAGTTAGGKKVAKTIKEVYGEDYYRKIGQVGGLKKNPRKGFGYDRERAMEMGRKGGLAPKKKRG